MSVSAKILKDRVTRRANQLGVLIHPLDLARRAYLVSQVGYFVSLRRRLPREPVSFVGGPFVHGGYTLGLTIVARRSTELKPAAALAVAAPMKAART